MKVRRITAPEATTGLLVVMALALGQWLHEQLPQKADSSRPYELALSVGESGQMRTGDVEVLSVDGATSVVPDGGDPLVTSGVFAIVEFTFTSRDQASALTYAALRDNRDRELQIFGGGRSSISCPPRLVGRPARCLVVVEADPDTLVGARVAVAPSGGDPRWDSMAVIDLGLEEKDVEAWLDREEPLVLPMTGELTRTEAS